MKGKIEERSDYSILRILICTPLKKNNTHVCRHSKNKIWHKAEMKEEQTKINAQ